MYGDFTLIDSDGSFLPARRIYLGASDGEGRDEAWLRNLILQHSETIPIAGVDETFGPLVPLCAEMRTGAGPIDPVFVNPQGRLTIVECKLWKNPEARRKVVGQVLDYLTALSIWSYADLQRQVSAAARSVKSSIYERVKQRFPEAASERDFEKAINESLSNMNILVLVIGDGIREEVQRLADTSNRGRHQGYSLGFVEFALYQSERMDLLIQPRVLAKTNIIVRKAVESPAATEAAGDGDTSVSVANGSRFEEAVFGEPVPTVGGAGSKQHLRDWWGPILNMTLDDAEQEPPYWTGSNNVVLRTSYPGVEIKAYAFVNASRMEVFVFVSKKADPAVRSLIRRHSKELELMLPPCTVIDAESRWPIRTIETQISEDDARREWIAKTLNAYVNVLRSRLRQWTVGQL